MVVTLPSLQGYPIEDFGYQLGRHWGIGTAKLSNGVLLIVAPNEHKVRIEVGYGLEGTLTDALSKIIIDNAILPKFRAGDYAGGIKDGVRDIIKVLTGDAAEVEDRAKARPDADEPDGRLADDDLLGADAVVDRLQRLPQRALRFDHRAGQRAGRSSCRGRAAAAAGAVAAAAGAAAEAEAASPAAAEASAAAAPRGAGR